MVKETSSTNIKKKRKTTATEHEAEIDIYKKVVDFEEKESADRQSSMDANIYFEMCQDIKEMLGDIFSRKCQKTVDPAFNRELLTEICIKLCVIKKLNRIDKIKHVFGKETLSTEKQKCDSIKLSYQNLVYELHHLLAETNKCLAFKSKDEEIELVTFEEFMKEAPSSLTKKFQKAMSSRGHRILAMLPETNIQFQGEGENSEDKHGLRLARLEWELTQRKSLAELCKSLVEEKKKLGQDLIERKEKLNTLRPLLMNIINATKPLQEHLDVPFDQLRAEHKLAFLLPDPLYIFYVNVVSYKNVYDLNLAIDILGDQDDAVQWKEAQEISNGGIQNDDDSERESDLPEVEEVVEVKKRRHRKSVQQVDPMEERKKKLLEVHPLFVEITAKVEDGPAITATFRYYTKLKIVTVTSKVNVPTNITANTAREILSGENILGELIEGDFGTKSPNPTTSYQLKKIGVSSYHSLVSQIGYAYTWAQGVCGIDFLTKQIGSEQIGSSNVENVMKVLFKRLAARNDLANQLQQLEQHIIPKIPASAEAPSYPVTSLTKWSSTTYQKFCQCSSTQALVEEDMASPSDLFYSANFSRGSANLQALIVIKNSYPEVPPIFSLCLKHNGEHHSGNSDEIRDLERVLNVDWECKDSSSWLLSAQITRLCSHLDVYLETLDPKAFPQNAMFLKNICARNRKRPFKFRKVGTGIFTQY